ncbi:hypothetical protein COU61_00155 [Candidatus Pacearchaeota archaeon CG10_big_fil_rev_8_21_14_0_10_35_13]|nr:MAG: hypothetical protein COU61_00155 [Candidatus Pacearchaeota archaeon CG10_big_fil_rev_8_21_14_0_10_35_13]
MTEKNIVMIRIKGMVGIPRAMEETLTRMRLRRKYACVIIKESKENDKIILKIRNHIAYGKISDEMLKELISKRGKILPGMKMDEKKVIEEINDGKKSKIIKPYFRLHPPRKGIKSKLHYPKGVLGNHGEEINKLLERML